MFNGGGKLGARLRLPVQDARDGGLRPAYTRGELRLSDALGDEVLCECFHAPILYPMGISMASVNMRGGFSPIEDDGDNIAPMRLAQLRKRKKLTQVELAEMSGVEQATISRIERGSDAVTLRTLRQIADALHVSVGDLFLDDRTSAEAALVQAFRALPKARQDGWLDIARTLVPPQTDIDEQK